MAWRNWRRSKITLLVSAELPSSITSVCVKSAAYAFQPNGPCENIFNFSNDLTWIHGRHSWKFGFDGRLYRPAALVQQLLAKGFKKERAEAEANLEDVFIDLTGHELRED